MLPEAMPDDFILHYRLAERLGSGGMGVVYKAEDTRLGRSVALKFLREAPTTDSSATDRFLREARSASSLNHPNICTIYEVGEHEGRPFIAMEFLTGQPLSARIANQPLPTEEILQFGIELADALDTAHAVGIIHRDVKPGNIFITQRGQAKLLDFGLAKSAPILSNEDANAELAESPTVLESSLTNPGESVGTPAYMSPEQARGERLDARSDVFSLGTVLYEMATGRRPFSGSTSVVVFDQLLNKTPEHPRQSNPSLPVELEKIIQKSMEKDRARRYQSARELANDLKQLLRQLISGSSAAIPARQWIRKPSLAIPATLLVLLFATTLYLFFRHNAKVRWAREQALPQISSLIEKNQMLPAFQLAAEARRYIPRDPFFVKLDRDYTYRVTIETTPPGADIFVKDYSDTTGDWRRLGTSPISDAPFPFGYFRWKFSKPGYDTVEAAASTSFLKVSVLLDPAGTLPAGMLRIPGGDVESGIAPRVKLPDFAIDKFEVTNRDFKKFLDAGGYRNPKYWRQPFVKDGRTLAFEQAMREFRDQTGRPGPSTWELGDFPKGQEDFPVGGVSWYEAAAYAEFAGKSLPTIYHWYQAADPTIFSDSVFFSNYQGKGPVRVGSLAGLNSHGTYDMAGNAKEWAWNKAGDARYILGGGWSEAAYMFAEADAQDPFDRRPSYGFRCIKNFGDATTSAELLQPIALLTRDYAREKPVPDQLFEAYKRFFVYDNTDLKPTIELTDDSPESWRRQRISYNATYGNERIIAQLYIPKNVQPPYQTIIYFPHAGAALASSSENVEMHFNDFIIKSGRALLLPICKGMYERRATEGLGQREEVSERSKDFLRSIDYLESRPDIDHEHLGFYGVSWGANASVVLLAVDHRIKAAVAVGGGFPTSKEPPEMDAINYAPRLTIPYLMINGRYDFEMPMNCCQLPLFKALGTPSADKRLALFNSGHLPPQNEIIRETLDWYDRYLGPVK
jgi:eukaryotic-like serine/threonine-protein kinase